ncbi:SH3 domain-containing protein [Phototrophicus methaneseepsis]|uniref:SH3 domain-containing protein n=1 Tax=Phototrophicus methaneseepsis TaxID=2710758 RepID=A0A7S8ECT0_9CHLR|nr:SH3 domain-containing protein [Phototrophicus methaneseepsis]QPC84564.1 SH3 domain-containing protein [Phototrophicus methaneseepsis]
MTESHLNPDQLADYLDKKRSAKQSFSSAGDNDPAAQVAQLFSKEQAPQLSAAARQRMEDRILQAVPSQPAPARIIPIGLTRLAAAAAVIVFMVLIPAVSDSAVPGDVLYGAKRITEQVELITAPLLNRRADVYMRLAKRRADEAAILLDRGIFSNELVNESLANLKQASIAEDVEATDTNQAIEIYAVLEYVANSASLMSLDNGNSLDVLATARADNSLIALPTSTTTPEADALIVDASPTAPASSPDAPITITMSLTPTQTTTMTATPSPTATTTSTTTATPSSTPTRTPTTITNTPVPTVETPTPPAVVLQPDITRVGYVKANGRVNVRETPNGTVITAVEPYTPVQIVEISDDNQWMHIILPNETEGWISRSLIMLGNAPNTPAQNANSGNASGGNPPDSPGNSGNAGNPPDNPGNSGNAGNSGNSGNPPDNPGNSGNAGNSGNPPDNPGNSGNSGNSGNPPDNPGNSGNAGNSGNPPDNPGNSGNAGNSGNSGNAGNK